MTNPHETLQELQKQLSQLKPAVTIYKDLEEVALKCASAAERATDLLKHLNSAYPQSLEDLEKKAVEKIEAVAGHAHQTLKTAERAISDLEKQAEASIAGAKKLMENHLAGSKDLMENLVQETEQKLQTELSRLKEVIEKEILAYRHLVEVSEKLIDKINAIDFPQRLDKIDANVSAINLGIQNIQNRLENVERNLKDEIKANREELATVNPKIEQLSKKQDSKFQIAYILLVVNALLVAGTLIFLLVR